MAQPTETFQVLPIQSWDLDPGALSSLSRTMGSVVTGFTDDIRTPQWDDMSDEEIVREFSREVCSEFGSLDRALQELEDANRSKFGPRSRAKPWVDRKESLQDYFRPKRVQVSASELNVSTFFVINANYGLPDQVLRPLSVRNALAQLPSSTNSGLPLLQRKGVYKEFSDSDLLDVVQTQKEAFYPAVLYTRTQEGYKTRNVWGTPMGMVLLEAMFYQTFLEYAKKCSCRAALNGPAAVDSGVTSLFAHSRRTGNPLVSIDFSRYDASIAPVVIRRAFDVIESSFQSRFRDEFADVVEMFLHVGIVTPEGVWMGPHGVASGSVFTNEIDSISQLIAAQEEVCQVQGDDGLYASASKSELIDRFARFGFEVNAEKTHESKDYCVYLQNYFSESYTDARGLVGIYPVWRAINRLVHLERWTNFEQKGLTGQDFFSLRAIMILENCKHHPAFRRLVEYVRSKDRGNLKFSESGLRAFISNLSRRTPVQMHQKGDQLSGLHQFATVQLLKTM